MPPDNWMGLSFAVMHSPLLQLQNTWFSDGHKFARSTLASQALIRVAKHRLQEQLSPGLSPRCTHVRGHGGAKASVRFVRAMCERLPYAARFDIKSYYESIDHRLLHEQLTLAQAFPDLCALVGDYLGLPDQRRSGKGMVAGGAISPLLAALYLTPLDRAMERLEENGSIRYQRFMDDFVIFAPTRWRLRAAIRQTHAVLARLKLALHPDKRFIGKTGKGFDFLGYHFRPGRKLQPAPQSLNRLTERARRLHERGASEQRLRQYVQRWFAWLHGGLQGRVGSKGGFRRIWVYVLKRLHLSAYRVRLR